MDRRIKALLILLGLGVLLYYGLGMFKGLTASGSVSPTTIQPGDSITLTVTSVSTSRTTTNTTLNWSYQEDTTTGWCGTDSFYGAAYCDAPTAISFSDCSNPYYNYATVVAVDGSGGISYDPTYDDFAIDEWCNLLGRSKVLVYGLGNGTKSIASVKPFNLMGVGFSGKEPFYVTVRGELRWRDTAVTGASDMFVGICVDRAFTPTFSYSYSGGTVYNGGRSFTFTGPDGGTYTCYTVAFKPNTGSTYGYVDFTVGGIPSDAKVYVVQGDTCYLRCKTNDSTYPCNDAAGYDKKVRVSFIRVVAAWGTFTVSPSANATSFTPSQADLFGMVKYHTSVFDYINPSSVTFNTSTTLPPGSYYFRGILSHDGLCNFYNYQTSNFEGYPGVTITGTSFTVVDYADTVSIDSVSVSSSDDEISSATITVSGGTTFDYVSLTSSCGGSKTVYPSSFSCSGTTCTWTGTLGFDTSVSGEVTTGSTTCTLTANLVVNGSTVNSATRSVTVYFPQVQNLSVSNTTSQTVSYSFTACGAFSGYDVYLDSLTNRVASKTLTPPSTPGTCRSVTDSVTISGLTSGTHTLYIRLKTSDGGEYDTASAQFTANITYNYSITNFTVDQPAYDVEGTSAPVTGTVSYSTDAPSAYLGVWDGTTEVWYATVTGTGTRNWSANLSCGDHTLTAKIGASAADVADSRTATTTVYCWSASIGPSGDVQVPADNANNILPTARVTVYYDISVNPQTDYTVSVKWNGIDITNLFGPSSGHIAEASVTPSDVPMNCGDSVTLTLEVYHAGNLVTTKTSNINLVCVQQYVIFRSPTDGAQYDTYGSADVPSDFMLPIAVDYAGGDTLKFYVNDSNIEVPVQPANCADLGVTANACYYLSGSFLDPGTNILRAELYSGSTLVTTGQVSFTVYAWSFQFIENYGESTGVLSVKEYGSHADSCQITFPELNVVAPMLYSDVTRTWDYSVTKDQYDGKEFNIVCYSPTGAEAYTYSGVVNFASAVSAAPVSGGGGGTTAVTPPEPPEAVPFWPEVAAAGPYKWSIVGKEDFLASMTSATVSESYVCVQPKQGMTVSVKYCPVDLPSIPDSADLLNKTMDEAARVGCSALAVKPVSGYQCVENQGPGVYQFTANGNFFSILVAGTKPGDWTVYLIGLAIILIIFFAYRYLR